MYVVKEGFFFFTLMRLAPSFCDPIANFFCGDWKSRSSLVTPKCPSNRASSTGELPSSNDNTWSWKNMQYNYSFIKRTASIITTVFWTQLRQVAGMALLCAMNLTSCFATANAAEDSQESIERFNRLMNTDCCDISCMYHCEGCYIR